MAGNILFFTHYLILLLFGVSLTFSFADIRFDKKNTKIFFLLCFVCGITQMITYYFLRETDVWKIYPFLSHVPTVIFLCTYYRKRASTTLAAVTTAYLCCQPANILGKLTALMFPESALEYVVRILVLTVVCLLLRKYCIRIFAAIFNRDNRSILAFSILPIGYYIYDYTLGIYTEFWFSTNAVAREILPTLVFVVFVFMCVAYYKEYAMRDALERKEQIIATTSQQQRKELEAMQRSSKELRLLRHDMRLLLESVAYSIDHGDTEHALEIVSGFTDRVNATSLVRYCQNETLNYIIGAFASKCETHHIHFKYDIETEELLMDEVLLASIISNALDNALNAQLELPESKRKVKLMIKHSDNRLLISVKNPFYTKPVFANGMPTTRRKGHGYGTQSIQYATERLGGNCQFSIQDDQFILRIVI